MNGSPVPRHNEAHMNRTAWMCLFLLAPVALSVGCAAGRHGGGGDDDDDTSGEEDCASGYDEDGDHLVDCFDPDCSALPQCILTEVCTNQIDDDHDTLVDCDDPTCASDPSCAAAPETRCSDQADDDGDGDVDCDDSDCATSPACEVQQNTDCDAVCAHESECGFGNPDCAEGCACSVDQMLAPVFAESFYSCIAAADCSIFSDSTPCFNQADFSSSALARQVVADCQDRADCEGIPCEYFGMFSDDALTDLSTCLVRGDCLTCLDDASSACPAL